MSSAGRGPLVQLNVGGVRYVTSRVTLLGGGGSSFFSGLVGDTGDALRGAGSFSPASPEPSRRRKRVASNGECDEEEEATEPLFIDRNGALFAHVLEFLRCGRRSGGPARSRRARARARVGAPPALCPRNRPRSRALIASVAPAPLRCALTPLLFSTELARCLLRCRTTALCCRTCPRRRPIT